MKKIETGNDALDAYNAARARVIQAGGPSLQELVVAFRDVPEVSGKLETYKDISLRRINDGKKPVKVKLEDIR